MCCPPIRYASILVAATVTYGRSPALPVAGALLPLVGGAADWWSRVGTCNVAGVTTNRVAAEALRIIFGPSGQMAAVREERLPPAEADPVVAPMVLGHEDGREETVDSLLDGLPFDAAGTFQHPGA